MLLFLDGRFYSVLLNLGLIECRIYLIARPELLCLAGKGAVKLQIRIYSLFGREFFLHP